LAPKARADGDHDEADHKRRQVRPHGLVEIVDNREHERDQERGTDHLVDERPRPVAEVLGREVAKIEKVVTESGSPRVMSLARS
jgi:hypothetical protein